MEQWVSCKEFINQSYYNAEVKFRQIISVKNFSKLIRIENFKTINYSVERSSLQSLQHIIQSVLIEPTNGKGRQINTRGELTLIYHSNILKIA